jgi:hypothetical protein
VVVLGPLRRRRNPIHMFASASRLQRGRSSAVTRIRTTAGTGTGTGTETFHLERREGGHVCEGVPCRSLGLSLSSGRGLERTHAFDRSHRRTCCHQEYKRMILSLLCFNFLCYLGYYYILYYTHGPPTMGQAQSADAFLAREPPYSTIPHVSLWSSIMSCRPLYHLFTKPTMQCL